MVASQTTVVNKVTFTPILQKHPLKMESKRARFSNITLSLANMVCEISLFGATVLSFSIGDVQLLFLSEKAVLDGSKPIRGGIPLVFPQFGPGDGSSKLPQHGFARTAKWEVRRQEQFKVVLGMDERNPAWDFPYALEYTIELSSLHRGSLHTSLRILNQGLVGQDPFEFQALQHTYLNVKDISTVSVRGLGKGAQFINQLENRAVQTLAEDEFGIDREVDSIFFGNPSPEIGQVIVKSAGDSVGISVLHQFVVASQPQPCDCVVWNPWIDKSQRMSDFGVSSHHTIPHSDGN